MYDTDELPATNDRTLATKLGLELLPNSPFSLEEAAEYLGVKERTLRDACLTRQITYTKLDRRTWRFTKKGLDEFIERKTKHALPENEKKVLPRSANGAPRPRGRPRKEP